ncbi:DUF6777 domain-containing protein [Streptomyces lavendulae]|uniref:DUF6777 domain-containing protein n=1 Tax=Streptomyces lavendulae TaxID=1914 RepID=UPI0036B898B1
MTTQPSGERPPQPHQPSPPDASSSGRPSGRPTGPPSGPLSGGAGRGPAGPPPPGPPGGPPPGAEPPGGSRPWWRSGPGIAAAVVALAAVAALVVVLTRPGGGGSTQRAGAEVFLQPASATGPAPFTESTAARQATPPPYSPAPVPSPAGTGTTPTRSVSGAAPGLYGGTKDVVSCDVPRQIAALTADPAKNAAFASALGIGPRAVPGYLRGLTPVQLRTDTRVTNHGYRDGRATPYQAVLQAGTAVLVDDRGVPRVRCACGNPLGAPVPLPANPKRSGQPWPSYRPSEVVVIAPSKTVVHKIVIYDHGSGRWYERERGAQPKPDRPVPPPVTPTPPAGTPSPVTSPPPSGATSPPVTGAPSTADTATPGDTATATAPAESPSGSPGDTSTPSGPASQPPALTDRGTPSGPAAPATPSGPSTAPPASASAQG